MSSIPGNCFVDSDGKRVKDKVEIELIELYDKANLLLSYVPTVSNGKMLLSEGSVYINAYQDGDEISMLLM